MKILEAVRFESELVAGGSTRPWLVLVADSDGELSKYIVKLFTEKNNIQQKAVAKEVFGNLLAREFDLPVADFGLINFSDDFIKTLPEEVGATLQDKDQRLKFGSSFKADMTIVDTNILRNSLKSYDIGTIFAFDNLVLNLDRGGFRNKPNLLANDKHFLLIDHEQIFPFADDAQYDVVKLDFRSNPPYYQYQKHLLFPIIQKMRNEEKQGIFDTFHESLAKFDINCLDEAAALLRQNDIPICNLDSIKHYLSITKSNAAAFCSFLNTLIV